MNRKITEKGYLLLTALAEGPSHGYALAQRVEALTEGATLLAVGTLYATLDRLLSDGLIEEAGDQIVDGRARRLFRISTSGRTRLIERARQLDQVVGAMHTALGTT
jgi:DNA-binding PadR family transcriptional regulator